MDHVPASNEPREGAVRRGRGPASDSRARPAQASTGFGRVPFEGEVRRVLVLADREKMAVGRMLTELEPWLAARVDALEVKRDLRKFSQEAARLGRPPIDELPDLIVVLGGDGSILSAVRAFAEQPIPTIGINFGRVGFLAAVTVGDWEDALTEVLDGNGVVEPRMRLLAEFESQSGRPSTAVALNDVVVARGAVQGMLRLSLRVGEYWLTDYRVDGLIVATASGSTAHSLAAGGPILAVSLGGMVVTPVCPQSLSHRPLVLHPESVLSIEVDRSSGLTTLAVDGQGFYPIHQGDRVCVWRHPSSYPILARPGSNPYRRVRERLGWRGTFEPGMDLESERPAPVEADFEQGEKL